ncbi:hypothetical protein CRYUN_Cryun29cG0078000 [Craigia yunnanensis]
MESKPFQLFYHLALTLVFIAYISVSATQQVVPSIKTDAVALLAFKKMIEKDPNGVLSGRKLERNPCSWYGVSCSSGRVIQLDLTQCSLSGTIFFNPLASLDIKPYYGFNSCLSNCTKLRTLNFSFNSLTGEIPSSFGELNSLQRLDLSHNHLTGWIPSELGNACDSLLKLKLSYNNFSGPAPISFSSCSYLQLLDLSNNNKTGPFPDSILQNLRALEALLLSSNIISGPFPIFKLSQSLNSNRVGALENFEQLIACFNDLEGKIPKELGKCRNLKDLILDNNRLSGEIPVEIFNCSNLVWISFTSNELTGSISRKFGLLSRLVVLQLANNSLSGEIPGELGNCTSLIWLDLNSNKLTGEIPSRLGRQLGAKSLSGILAGNTLVFVRNVGNSSKGVGGLSEFAAIRPERLLQIPNLKSCDFMRMYSGAVSSPFTQYQTLVYLNLSYNELRGKIPKEIGEMVALQVLELAHNQLSGEIPPSLGQLRNLDMFDASHNRLQGQIPESFSNLSFLEWLLPIQIWMVAKKVGSLLLLHGLIALSWAICILIVWAIAMRARRKEAEEVRMLNRLQAAHAATSWKIDKEKESLSIKVATFQRKLRKLRFAILIEATNGFSAASLIGCGGLGEVFKATLKDGSSVAIKKLIRLSNQGTPCYVPPEYYQSFRCTAKCDVYSFGVVLLELWTGRRPTDKDDFGDTNLVGWVKMKCVNDFHSKRPNMLQVVALLRELMPGSANGSSSSA